MNNTFSFQRFWWLLKKTMFEKKLVFFGILLLALLLSLLLSKQFYMDPARTACLVLGLYLGNVICLSACFDNFSSKKQAIAYLTIPHSFFEKFLVMLTFATLYAIIFLSIFSIADQLLVNYTRAHTHSPWELKLINDFDFWGAFTSKYPNSNIRFSTYFMYSALILVGSLYFKEKAGIKTLLSFITLMVAAYYVNQGIASLIFHKQVTETTIYESINFESYSLTLPKYMQQIISITFRYVVTIGLWLTILIRLREKEI